MSAIELFFANPVKTQILLVELDAAISETHTGKVEKTNHPIEGGTDITDHLRRLPDALTITGEVTNTPIVSLASVAGQSPVAGDITPVQDRVEVAFAELTRAKDAGEIGEVITSLKTYKNMAIIGLTVRRDKDSGNALDVTVDLEETLIASTETIEAPPNPKKPGRRKTRNQGRQAKNKDTSKIAQDNTDFLSGFASWITGA